MKKYLRAIVLVFLSITIVPYLSILKTCKIKFADSLFKKYPLLEEGDKLLGETFCGIK